MAPAPKYLLHEERFRLQSRAAAAAKPSQTSGPDNAGTSSPDGSFHSLGPSAITLICGAVVLLVMLSFLWCGLSFSKQTSSLTEHRWLRSKARQHSVPPPTRQQAARSQAFKSLAKQTSKKAWRSSLTDGASSVSPYVLNQDSW